jgi:hypothetical protein
MKPIVVSPSGPGKYIVIGSGGRPILFSESIPTGGGPGPEPGPLVGIRALANVYSVTPPTGPLDYIYISSGSYVALEQQGYEISNPVNSQRQRFYLSLPSASRQNEFFFASPSEPAKVSWRQYLEQNDVVWSSYNNEYIAYGVVDDASYPNIYTSPNGKLWKSSNILTGLNQTNKKLAVNSNTGQIVLVGNREEDILYFSYDLTTAGTGSVTGSRGPAIKEVVWSSDLNRYVAVGSSDGSSNKPYGPFLYSNNGINWMTGSLAADYAQLPTVTSVVWCPTQSLFVAGLDAFYFNTFGQTYTIGGVMTSPDGVTWTRRNAISESIAGFTSFRVLEKNGKLVAYSVFDDLNTYDSPYGYVATSSNGIDWTKIELPDSASLNFRQSNNPYNFVNDNKFYFSVYGDGTNNQYMTSSDGTTWGNTTLTKTINDGIGFTPTYNGRVEYKSPTQLLFYSDDYNFFVADKTEPLRVYSHYEDSIAIAKFETSQSADIYNTYLPWYEAEGTWAFISASGDSVWTDFNLYLRDDDLNVDYTGNTTGSIGAGIIISSSGYFVDANTYDGGLQDTTVDGVRYIQEYDTDVYNRTIYLERQIPGVSSITRDYTASISITAKSNGRRYMYLYGYFYNYPDYSVYSEYGLIVDLIGGSVTYYEDPTIISPSGSFGQNGIFASYNSTDYQYKFNTAPTMTDVGDGFWNLSFELSARPYPQHSVLRSGSIYFTSGSFS